MLLHEIVGITHISGVFLRPIKVQVSETFPAPVFGQENTVVGLTMPAVLYLTTGSFQ